MKRLNLELVLGALVCILASVAIAATIIWDYLNFRSLPPVPATASTVELLKQMHVDDLKFMACIAVAFCFMGSALLSNWLRRRKLPPNDR